MIKSMRSSVKGSIPKKEKAKKSTLLNQFIEMKYGKQGCVRAHIMNMIDIGSTLQELNMNVDESMMVHFASTALLKEFKSIKSAYIAQKETWTLNVLITICLQKEHNKVREKGRKIINLVQIKHRKDDKENKQCCNWESEGKQNCKSLETSRNEMLPLQRRWIYEGMIVGNTISGWINIKLKVKVIKFWFFFYNIT